MSLGHPGINHAKLKRTDVPELDLSGDTATIQNTGGKKYHYLYHQVDEKTGEVIFDKPRRTRMPYGSKA
jgi:hypothetical protein